VVQRPGDDPAREVVADRFDDRTQARVRPPGSRRADADRDRQRAQPRQSHPRPAGQEAVVHGTGGEVTGEQRRQRLGGRPPAEPGERTAAAAQRPHGEPQDLGHRVAPTAGPSGPPAVADTGPVPPPGAAAWKTAR